MLQFREKQIQRVQITVLVLFHGFFCANAGAWTLQSLGSGRVLSGCRMLFDKEMEGLKHSLYRSIAFSSVWEALDIFDHLRSTQLEVDAVCCGTALQACSKRGWQRGIGLFWETRLQSIQPSLISSNVLLRAVSKHEPWAKLLRFLSWMMMADFTLDSHTFGALGSLPWAFSLRNVRDPTTPILLNTVISSMPSKSWPWSFQLLGKFHLNRLAADTVLLNSLLTTLERSCQWQSAIQFLVSCMKKSHGTTATPNTVSFNACLSACDAAHEVQQALLLLHSMEKDHDTQPDVVSFSAVLSACAKTAQWETALEQVADMRLREVSLDTIACNSLTSTCAEAMQWERSLQLLDSDTVDTVTFNAVLKGLEKSMLWQHALAILSVMEVKQVKASLITYNTLMSTCQKCSQWEWSMHILSNMAPIHQLGPDLVSYNTCLAACKKGTAWQESLVLSRNLQRT